MTMSFMPTLKSMNLATYYQTFCKIDVRMLVTTLSGVLRVLSSEESVVAFYRTVTCVSDTLSCRSWSLSNCFGNITCIV